MLSPGSAYVRLQVVGHVRDGPLCPLRLVEHAEEAVDHALVVVELDRVAGETVTLLFDSGELRWLQRTDQGTGLL